MAHRAVVYVHEEYEGPALFGPALRKAGFEMDERFRAPKLEDAQAELLVVLGGPMAVYELEHHGYLKTELEVIRKRLALDRPTIGICLGAQLLAAAAGARVYAGGAGVELGVFPVMLTSEGRHDEIFRGLAQTLDVAHWHGDTFDPVPNGVLLMSSERYPQQAFRVGRSYGIQFHPELDPETFARWLDEAPDGVHASGRFVEELRQDDLPKLKKTTAAWAAFLERLVEFTAGALANP